MSRTFITLTVFLVLSAWAGAQNPAGLTTAEQKRLLQANRSLLDELIDQGIDLAGAGAPLDRAEKCQGTVRSLANALERAASDQDADRVVEMGNHLEKLIRDGLAPTLDQARGMIPVGSPDEVKLKEVRRKILADLDEVKEAIPTTGKIGDHGRVKDLRGQMDGLRERLK